MLPISQPVNDGLSKTMRVLKIGQVLGLGDSGGGETRTAAPRRPPRNWPPEHLICVDKQSGARNCEFEPTERNDGGAQSVIPDDSAADVSDVRGSHAQAQRLLPLGAAEGAEGVEIHLPEVRGLSQ